MELWTIISKNTNELIRINNYETGDDQGIRYYFTDSKYAPYWFVDSKEKVENALVKYQLDDQYYETPCTESINIDDYKIIKFKYEEYNNI